MQQLKSMLLGAVALAAGAASADTPYPMSEETAAANRAKVVALSENAYWKGSPLAACAVDAMSWIRRTPDVFPEDGDFTGPVRLVAAKGEFESGSFQLYGLEGAEDVLVTVGDLTCGAAKIPASAVDLKTVKVWYQSGSGWDGCFFSDFTRRGATPELLLHDDALVDVDHVRRQYFVRCDYKEGPGYYWTSFNSENVFAASRAMSDLDHTLVRDAKALVPFRVRKGEFKQLMFALEVPKSAAPGVYRGAFAVKAKGAKLFDIPLCVRVLPFELPKPATFRDLKRPFRAKLYNWGGRGQLLGTGIVDSPAIARNIAVHNATAAGRQMGDPCDPKAATVVRDALKASGGEVNFLDYVVNRGPYYDAGKYPLKPGTKEYEAHQKAHDYHVKAMENLRAVFGKDVLAYTFGSDEAPPPIVRAQREIFKDCQSVGCGVCVASHYYPFLLFNIDMLELPGQARYSVNSATAEKVHAAEPDFLLGWYADPHSGPENPDYARRLYGLQAWRANYDMCCQFIFFRNNWNDFWIPEEKVMRGLMLVYPQCNDILDTTQWEGLREGLDDVRYATYLLQLCEEARKSADIDVVYAARAARTWLAQVDVERAALNYLRLETIRRILQLREMLGKRG